MKKFKIFDLVTPLVNVSSSVNTAIFVFWVAIFLFIWITQQSAFFPTPRETIAALPDLWNHQGLGVQIIKSFMLNVNAVAIMASVSYLLALSTVMPIGGPLATLVSSGRFNGFVCLPIIFLAMLHDPYKVKIALLVFGMGVFTVLSLTKMIEGIPKEKFDHSRTLCMGRCRVVWEVIVQGKLDEVIDILRINIAMGWMMLPMVEGRFKNYGGVGALMEDETKHLNLDAVFCVLFVILAVGLLQDAVLVWFKKTLCPWSQLGMEKI